MPFAHRRFSGCLQSESWSSACRSSCELADRRDGDVRSSRRQTMNWVGRSDASRLGAGLAAVAVVTLTLGHWLRVPNAATVSTTYLMVVLVVAATSRLRVAVTTSIAAMLCLNFFFLPPV